MGQALENLMAADADKFLESQNGLRTFVKSKHEKESQSALSNSGSSHKLSGMECKKLYTCGFFARNVRTVGPRVVLYDSHSSRKALFCNMVLKGGCTPTFGKILARTDLINSSAGNILISHGKIVHLSAGAFLPEHLDQMRGFLLFGLMIF